MALKIKNWKHFQHFKDRRPPWIKLHRILLDDPDFNEMPPEDGLALIKLWLIASELMGELPCIKKIAYRLRIRENEAEQLLGRLCSWFEPSDDIAMISSRYQLGPPETETETEAEAERKQVSKNIINPDIQVESFPLIQEDIDNWVQEYPLVDIQARFRGMDEWLKKEFEDPIKRREVFVKHLAKQQREAEERKAKEPRPPLWQRDAYKQDVERERRERERLKTIAAGLQ